ncbi:hypothetical protein SCUCBS95973_001432 [Sporothrix curviconia]|uniref:xylan 1,4-beta-xylosidase n=1 Tax=Sporothrix curviconia TaxID=1260050 RepID=A0ABP0AZ41_9PEZI
MAGWFACVLLTASLAKGALGQGLQPPGQKPLLAQGDPPSWHRLNGTTDKAAFIDALVANMTIEDLDHAMRFSPDAPVGNVHDLYALNASRHNSLQRRNLAAARLPVPFLQLGECLHGVGSFKQSLFPQPLGLASAFDPELVRHVGRAIGSEARSIGIHACLAPVLDLGRDARWGRTQEGWGEDKVLTTHMGVAFARGLSKDGALADADAVAPVMKHFAAHGAPAAGRNTAPFVGRGTREVLQELLMPFQAAVELGGVRGVMMAYNELDGVPAAVHPLLYAKLAEWGFDGVVLADDTAVRELETVHRVARSPADAIGQWFNAGGMVQFYDYPLDVFLNSTRDLVADGTVSRATLQAHVRAVMGVKWDLGLFQQPLVPDDVDPAQLVADHRGLAREAAQKSIVLLKNDNKTLPLRASQRPTVALLGPFADTLNFGDYAGTWGQAPATDAATLRQALLQRADDDDAPRVRASWAADSWEYVSQNVVPPYLLSPRNRSSRGGGLTATYYPNVDFSGEPRVLPSPEVPALDWGLFPPPGLPSANFSAVWEGTLASPVDVTTDGWIGVAVGPCSEARLFIDDQLVVVSGSEDMSASSSESTVLGNILPWSFVQNQTRDDGPPGAAPFTFQPQTTHRIRIEYRAWGAVHRLQENVASLRSQMLLFWNLVDRSPTKAVRDALDLAAKADVVVLAVGSAWNSDGENGDRCGLGLPPSQDALVEAVLSAAAATAKNVVLVLFGGRPLAIPHHYRRAAAVVAAFFPGPAGGPAIADVLYGVVDPGGSRLPRTVPRDVGQLPVRYDDKPSARSAQYVDAAPADSLPCFPFGHGMSYTSFSITGLAASSSSFTSGDTIAFSADVRNTGARHGSFTLQVYLLGRVSVVTQPVRQLVAFQRVDDVAPGETRRVTAPLDVDRVLRILDRHDRWLLERGVYEFAARAHGGDDAEEFGRVTLHCV